MSVLKPCKTLELFIDRASFSVVSWIFYKIPKVCLHPDVASRWLVPPGGTCNVGHVKGINEFKTNTDADTDSDTDTDADTDANADTDAATHADADTDTDTEKDTDTDRMQI